MKTPQDEFSKKKSSNLQIISLRNSKGIKCFSKRLRTTNLVQSMKNRRSDVIDSKNDLITY